MSKWAEEKGITLSAHTSTTTDTPEKGKGPVTALTKQLVEVSKCASCKLPFDEGSVSKAWRCKKCRGMVHNKLTCFGLKMDRIVWCRNCAPFAHYTL